MTFRRILSDLIKNKFASTVLKTSSLQGVIMGAVAIVLRGDRGLKLRACSICQPDGASCDRPMPTAGFANGAIED